MIGAGVEPSARLEEATKRGRGIDLPTVIPWGAVSRRGLSAISEQENGTVKKTVLATGGFIALGLMCYVGQLAGQNNQPTTQQPAAQAPARTRIALLNLTYVLKNYVKYQRFQEEVKAVIDPFQNKDKELRGRLETLRKQADESAKSNPSTPNTELERQAKDIQRQLEDNSTEAKLQLGKRTENEMKILYGDVYEAAQRYATSHDFDLVLQYNDATTPEDFMSAQNIARKLQTGALMPLYWPRSIDISQEVTNALNYNARSTTAPGGGAAPGTPPQTGSNP
jgi:Skp family chaperone for outer membrane proteins